MISPPELRLPERFRVMHGADVQGTQDTVDGGRVDGDDLGPREDSHKLLKWAMVRRIYMSGVFREVMGKPRLPAVTRLR